MKFQTLYTILESIRDNREINYYNIQILTKYGLNTIQKYVEYLENFGYVDAIMLENTFKWFITKEGLTFLTLNKKMINKLKK